MTTYSIGEIEFQRSTEINYIDFLEIIKGRSLIGANDSVHRDASKNGLPFINKVDFNNGRIEFDLSGGLKLRIFQTLNETEINLIRVESEEYTSSFVVNLGDMKQQVPISDVVKKLNGLRTLYSIFFLIQNGRAKELQSALINHPHGDIEQMLDEDDKLYIESISYGSWIGTFYAKSKKAYKAIVSVAGFALSRTREAFIKKQEAEARLISAQADKLEIEVDAARFNLKKDKWHFLQEAINEMDIPEAKEILKRRMIEASRNFLTGDNSDGENYKQLDDGSK